MKGKDSFAQKLKKIFMLLIGICCVSELYAILGMAGVGNKVINIIVHGLLLIINIVIAVNGYGVLTRKLFAPIAEMGEAVNSLAASYGAAVGTLRSIAENPKEQAQARVNAAKALLDYGRRFSEASSGGSTTRVVFVDDITGTPLPAPRNQEEAQPDADT